MSSLWSDLRFAMRGLTRRRGFSIVALTTIAVGIAIAASLFAVIDGALLRPLPFHDPSQLVAVWQTNSAWKRRPGLKAVWESIPFSIPEYLALSSNTKAFAGVAIWSEDRLPLTVDRGSDYVRVTKASWTMARLLGVTPTLGRYFSAEEDQPNGQPVALVSNEEWHDRYGGDSNIVGRSIQLDHASYVVIGVLPRGLTLDRQQDARSKSVGGAAFPEYWIPVGRDSGDAHDADRKNYRMVARLMANVSIDWAAQVATRSLRSFAKDGETRGVRIENWQAEQTQPARTPLLILGAAASFLLLIACANVALLTLGDVASRQHEMAIRVAVGGSRTQLIRQVVAESVVVCVAGAILALPLSLLTTKLLLAVAPFPLAALATLQPDARVLLFGFVATAISALIAGAAPVALLSRLPPAPAINAGAQRDTGRGRSLQLLMIGLQMAMATALMIGATLLFRTFEEVARIDPGFDADNLLVAQLILPTEIWADTLRARLMYTELFSALATSPEISHVSGTSQPPLLSGLSSTTLTLRGDARTMHRDVQYRAVAPEYFRTMGIKMVGGRDFTDADRAGVEAVAVVSRALVRRDFANRSAVGQHVQLFGRWRTVVGVVDDVHFTRPSDSFEPTIYVPFAQLPGTQLDLVVRTRHDPVAVETSVRNDIHRLAPTVGVQRIDLMASAFRRSFAEETYRAALMATFSIIATFLAVISTYGVTVRSVRNRRREAAIRLSLGASNASVMALMMGPTVSGLMGGAAAGMAIAGATERWLRPYLFHVSGTDPRVYAAIVLGLTVIVLGANWFAVRGIADLDLTRALAGKTT